VTKKAKKKPLSRRPNRDPALTMVLNLIADMTPTEISRTSGHGVSTTTISAWRRGKTRFPQHYTLVAALSAAGYEYVPIIKEDKAGRPRLAVRRKAANAPAI